MCYVVFDVLSIKLRFCMVVLDVFLLRLLNIVDSSIWLCVLLMNMLSCRLLVLFSVCGLRCVVVVVFVSGVMLMWCVFV